MGAAEDFFGTAFNTVKEAVNTVGEKASKTTSNALEFFGIDFGTPKQEQTQPEPSKPQQKALTVDDVMPKLIQAESGGKHLDEKGKLTTSPVGAQGVTQLMPTTAKKPGYGITPVKDQSEEEYMRVGKQYLQKMYDKFNDWEKALAAYNAGVGNVMKAEGKAERFGGDWKDYLPKKSETLPYIEKILNFKEKKEEKKPDQIAGVFDRKQAPIRSGSQTGGVRGRSGVLESAAEMYASASRPVNISEMAGQALGEKTLEATGSPAAATAVDVATQMFADPTNIAPLGKVAAIVGAVAIPIKSSLFKTLFDPKTGYSSRLNNPIHLGDSAPKGLAGSRLSGFTTADNRYFVGYDKNGEIFTIATDRIDPKWITSSRDGNKTANYIKERLSEKVDAGGMASGGK